MSDPTTYAEIRHLAALHADAAQRVRDWARLGAEVLTDPDVTESAVLSPRTWREAEDEIRAATTDASGLLDHAVELDADAVVLRATVGTLQWIDELREAAYQTLGAIAGRALGHLAPEVTLGGTIVAAGLIETDSLDRDGVAAYLNELAEANPDLMEHVTTGGPLLDSLHLRGLLTSDVVATEGAPVREGGLRAIGVEAFGSDVASALRDAAHGFDD